jgi:hypothetical protein
VYIDKFRGETYIDGDNEQEIVITVNNGGAIDLINGVLVGAGMGAAPEKARPLMSSGSLPTA